MRKILLMCFTVLGILLSQSIIAQTKTVTGSVVDASTNEKLPGSTGSQKSPTTGVFIMPGGNFSISFSPGEGGFFFWGVYRL